LSIGVFDYQGSDGFQFSIAKAQMWQSGAGRWRLEAALRDSLILEKQMV